MIPVKKTVPADWYNSLKNADAVRDNLGLAEKEGVVSTEVRPPKFGGAGPSIRVGVPADDTDVTDLPIDEIIDSIPSEKDGVPIEIERVKIPEVGFGRASPNDHSVSTTSTQEVKGGEQMWKENNDAYCTVGSALYSEYNSDYEAFITTQHLWYGEDPDSTNPYAYYPSYDTKLAQVSQADCQLDYAILPPENNYSPTQEAECCYSVTGEYTKDATSALAAEDALAKKYGAKTGYTSGVIESADATKSYVHGGCNNRYNQVVWGDTGDFDQGDSGSVAVHQWDDQQAWAICLNAAHEATNPKRAFGTGAYEITSGGYTFG